MCTEKIGGYYCRVLNLEGRNITVGPLSLALKLNDMYKEDYNKASYIDEQISYFVDDADLKKDDGKLLKIVKDECPELFECS